MHDDHNRQATGTAPTGRTPSIRKAHRTVIAHAAGHVYARCACGWEGTHRPYTRDAIGNAQALRAADRECNKHTEQVTHDAR